LQFLDQDPFSWQWKHSSSEVGPDLALGAGFGLEPEDSPLEPFS
jgi:hypothetical protein